MSAQDGENAPAIEIGVPSDTKKRISLPSGREILLVGTAHVSSQSVEEVRAAIRDEAPDRVCVEIDAGRYRTLAQSQDWAGLDIVKVIKEGKVFLLLANLVLSSFQRKMGSSQGVQPGEEMKAAVKAAEELGIPCEFSDREVQVTLRRAWNKSNLWNRSKLLAALISSAFTSERPTEAEIEELKKKSALEDMMGELADYLPTVKEVLIDERDRYLAAKIWEGGKGRTLAVVGAGHMGGIEAWLAKFESGEASADVADINSVPAAGPWGKIIGWAIPALLVALIILGFFSKGAEFTLEKIIAWIVVSGGLSALGAVAALAHPLTILVAFVGSPLATLNPFMTVGMFTGLSEAFLRKPSVKDFENLHADVNSAKGFWKNRVLRILLAFLLPTLGLMIGNLVAAPLVLTFLKR
jgi:pheromone shutdown-related protein TraB